MNEVTEDSFSKITAEDLNSLMKRIDQLQRELGELQARSVFVDEELRNVVNSEDFDICSDSAIKLSNLYFVDAKKVKDKIEVAAVEKFLPPVMTLTTIPVACREPADYMIGFNRCRNEIKRNMENQSPHQDGIKMVTYER